MPAGLGDVRSCQPVVTSLVLRPAKATVHTATFLIAFGIGFHGG